VQYHDNASLSGRLKMREWKHRHDFAGVENAGVETSARFCRGGKCRSRKIGTILQGWKWKMREWKHRERSILQNVMLGSAEKRMVRLISREIVLEEFQRISSQSTNVTNRRTETDNLIMAIPRYATHQMGVVSSKIAIFASCGHYIFRNVIRDQNYYVSVCIVPKWLFVDIEQMTK